MPLITLPPEKKTRNQNTVISSLSSNRIYLNKDLPFYIDHTKTWTEEDNNIKFG